MDTIQSAQHGDCLRVRLARPNVRNALTREDFDCLEEIADRLTESSEIDFVIVEGEGPVFCAGADRVQNQEVFSNPAILRAHIAAGCRLCDKLQRLPQMTIASLNGPAIGFGCHLALSLDFRFCVASTYFQLPEGPLGISDVYHFAMLERCLGPDRAMEMTLRGNKIDSETAFAMGLCTARLDSNDNMKTDVDCFIDALRGTPATSAVP